jgi:hypothetical protein
MHQKWDMFTKEEQYIEVISPNKLTNERLTIAKLTSKPMSITFPNSPYMFSPFYAILQDEIDRLFELLPCEEFTFIVKGESLKTTLSEAILISPMISERLKTDPTNREFEIEIENDEVEMKQFSNFVELIRDREQYVFRRENELIFLSICKLIGNEQLSVLILGSVDCDIS